MYQDKRYKKQLQKNGPLAARRSMLAESISTDSLKEKIFTLLNNRSEEKQYAFLMTDVDNFHLINDYWGYEMGTNILNFILKKLELFPQTLFVNRYHSDIFVGIIDITWQDPAWCGKRFPPITSRRSASSTIGISAFPWTISDRGILL